MLFRPTDQLKKPTNTRKKPTNIQKTGRFLMKKRRVQAAGKSKCTAAAYEGDGLENPCVARVFMVAWAIGHGEQDVRLQGV